jgi:hypothetical protein
MIIDFPEYIPDIRKFGHHISGFRTNNGMPEFALKTCHGGLSWFPYSRLSQKAELYVNALMKTGALEK